MNYPTLSDLNSPALVSPFGARRSRGSIGPLAAMISTEPDFRYITANAGRGEGRPFFTSTLFTREAGEKGAAFAGPYTGAPYAVMLLESLIASGCEKIFVLGWCGAISENVKTGDLVVAESALCDEGTSRHYSDDSAAFPLAAPSRSATGELVAGLFRAGLSHKTGRIWTTDGIYRETEKKIDFFRQKGAIAVEMECSALFSAARYRKQKIAALLVVSDELSSSSWHPGFREPRFKQARKDAAQVIRELLSCDNRHIGYDAPVITP